jgi:DNA-binding transcriptional MerR regulator
MLLKIGQLASQTGLTVRTLHHYDAIGLLRPNGRAENGYRMYNRADVARLHQIQALRRLGLSLEETGALLDGENKENNSIGAIVAQQVEQLNSQIERATLLRDRLLRLQEDFAADAEPDLQEWLATLELMAIFDKHLTLEEAERWRSHSRENRRAEAQVWKALLTEVQRLKADRVPPDAPQAQDIARRWIEQTDPHIKRSPHLMLKLDAMYREEPAMQAAMGTDPALFDYIGCAALHYRLGLYARHLEPAQFEAIRPRYLDQPPGAWVALSRDLRALMERGAPATDPEVQSSCARWRTLFEACFGSDPAIQARVLHAQATDPLLTVGSSWDVPLRAYLQAGLEQLDNAEETRHA